MIHPQSCRFQRVTSQCQIRPDMSTAAVFSLESSWFFKHLSSLCLPALIHLPQNVMNKQRIASPTAPQPSALPFQALCVLQPSSWQWAELLLHSKAHLSPLLAPSSSIWIHSGVLRTPTPYHHTPILLYFLQANGTIMEPWVWSEVCSLFPLTNTQNSRRKMNFSPVRSWSLTLVVH